MKKLMIIAAAMAMAVSANAASYVWKTHSSGGVVVLPGTTPTPLASAQAYIFAAGQEQAIFDAFKTGTLDLSTAGALDSSAIANSQIKAKTDNPFTYSGDITAFIAVVTTIGGKESLYISPTATGADTFGSGYDTIQIKAQATSSLAATSITSTSTWSGNAGWYQVESVPEPTSGLLLLLGVAGLALRRRRA